MSKIFQEPQEDSMPIVNEVFADNGAHSHWEVINPNNGKILWTESDETPSPPSTRLADVIKEMRDDLERNNYNRSQETLINHFLPKLKAITDLPLQDGYWKKRCEAAEKVIEHFREYDKLEYVINYDDYAVWETLKSIPVQDEKKDDWISCEVRLPENKRYYL